MNVADSLDLDQVRERSAEGHCLYHNTTLSSITTVRRSPNHHPIITGRVDVTMTVTVHCAQCSLAGVDHNTKTATFSATLDARPSFAELDHLEQGLFLQATGERNGTLAVAAGLA